VLISGLKNRAVFSTLIDFDTEQRIPTAHLFDEPSAKHTGIRLHPGSSLGSIAKKKRKIESRSDPI